MSNEYKTFYQEYKRWIWVLILVLLIVFNTIFAFVFLLAPIAPNQYGIGVTGITNKIELDQVYENGLHYRPFGTFILYPANLVSVEFANVAEDDSAPDPIGRQEVRSQDGLDVSFRINFNYRLIKEEIIPLYQDFNNRWQQEIIDIARGALRTASGQFTAIQFFNNVSMIQESLRVALDKALSSAHAKLAFFQLKGVKLPDAFEAALERVQTSQQQIEVAEYEQEEARVRANTLIIEAEAQAEIVLVEANAEAERIRIHAEAIADELNITITAKGLALLEVANSLGLNTTEILTYMWIQAIELHDESLLIIGADTPVLIQTNQSTP